MSMKTVSIGNASLAKCVARYVEQGYTVSLPVGDAAPYDMIVEKDGAVQRVQVKTGKLDKGVIYFPAKSNCGRWYKTGETKDYRGKADLFVVYCPQTDKVYALPVDSTGLTSVYLRVTMPKNGQRTKVRFAQDYEI